MHSEILMNEWFDKWTRGDYHNLPISDDFIHESPYGIIQGKTTYIQLVEENKDKFLGHRFELLDQIYEPQKAVVRYIALQKDFAMHVCEWQYSRNQLIYKIVAYYNIPGEIRSDRKLRNLEE